MGTTVNWRPMARKSTRVAVILAAVVVSLSSAMVSEARSAEPAGRFEFTRMVAHWHPYNPPADRPFLGEARPDVVHQGVYGGPVWRRARCCSCTAQRVGSGWPRLIWAAPSVRG